MAPQSKIMITITTIIFFVFLAIIATFIIVDLIKAKKNKKRHLRFNPKSSISAYLMLLPASILAFFFVVLPILYSLGYAFTDYRLLYPNDIQFNGFQNFVKIYHDIENKTELYYAIINTVNFVIGVVPLQIGLALGLAIFCNRKKPGVGIFKVCFFAPVVISLSVTAILWKEVLSPEPTGLLNSLLGIFGLGPFDYMGDPKTTMLWIVILSAWQGCGFQMLIFLSALSNIRKDLYEAASLDGANSFQKFWYITLPQLKPTFVYILVTVFIGASRILVQPMMLIGEEIKALTISYYMFLKASKYFWVGESSAIALIMTVIMGIVTLIQRKLLEEKD